MNEPRLAQLSDVPVVAKIHIEAFPDFFLTTLGLPFLRVMYRSFLLDASGVFIVNERDGRVCGFAVGTLNSSKKDQRLALASLPRFIWALAPAILRHPIAITQRIASRFFSRDDELKIPKGAVVLRSIGVLPIERGSGAAAKILEAFEVESRKISATCIALTTDELDNERAIGFYRKQGYTIAQNFKQDKHRRMLLLVKIFN